MLKTSIDGPGLSHDSVSLPARNTYHELRNAEVLGYSEIACVRELGTAFRLTDRAEFQLVLLDRNRQLIFRQALLQSTRSIERPFLFP
jgi:hypothetical protein